MTTFALSAPLTRDSPADEMDVVKVKKLLNRLGLYLPYEKTGITGMTDRALFEAIAAFQRHAGLPISGEMRPDDATVRALSRAADEAPDGHYIWRTVEDDHVRPAHALLNRTLRSWSEVPDPGDDYHCRCWAVPVAQEKIDQLYADAIEPVYPEAYIIPALRAGLVVNALKITFSRVLKNYFNRGIRLNDRQKENFVRFLKKIPANSRESVRIEKNQNSNIVFKATSSGKVPGSRSVYKKTVDQEGNTIAYTKTTYDNKGNIAHIKDKMIYKDKK